MQRGKKIYQYAGRGRIFWIAAPNEEKADAEARRRGWRKVGSGGLYREQAFSSRAELRRLKVDVTID